MSVLSRRIDSGAEHHVPALDGVRGIAILMILVYHTIFQTGVTSLVDRLASRAASFGWTGVDLFFVLSGFLITGILLDSKSQPRYLTNFYVRRLLRIFPLYYLFLVVAIVVVPAFAPDPALVDPRMHATQWWHWTYCVNILIALRGQQGPPADTGHFWSLAVEEQFYMVWPLLVHICSRVSFKRAVVATIVGAWVLRIVMVAGGADYWTVYVLTLTRADALAAGALLAILAREPGGLARYAKWARPLAIASFALIVADFVFRHRLFAGVVDPLQIDGTLVTMLGASVLLGAVNAPAGSRTSRFYRSPTLRFFGRYSYCLYVVHFPIVHFLERELFPKQSFPRIGDVMLPGTILLALLTIAASLSIALVSWPLFEAPFLRLKRFFPIGGVIESHKRTNVTLSSASSVST